MENKTSQYKRFQPKPLKRDISNYWFVKRKPYLLFIIRELTSIFVAAYAIILLFQLNALRQGPEAWEGLISAFSTPFSITMHVLILLFVLFHTITWFQLAPSAMVMKVGKTKIPGTAIIAVNFLMWIILSVGIVWIVMSL